jgi:glyoxylase-like metal-dependent hydrolase (beta-lactamase superfamily II)
MAATRTIRRLPIDYFNWVITNDKRTFVVDAGFDEETAKRRVREVLKPAPLCLKAVGCDPGSVTDVIITHMRYDHAGNHDLLSLRPVLHPGQRNVLRDRPLHVPRVAAPSFRAGGCRHDGA